MAKSQKKARLPTSSTKIIAKTEREAGVEIESKLDMNDESPAKEIHPQEQEKRKDEISEELRQQKQVNSDQQLAEEPSVEERMRSISKEIKELGSLSSAIEHFKRSFYSLQKHLESISSAIDKTFEEHPINKELQSTEVEISDKKSIESNGAEKETEDTQNLVMSVPDSETFTHEKQSIEHICVSMSSKFLRRYLQSNLTDISNLRKEVLEALKLAPNPAKLVLESVGKFYLQGKKAFTKVSPLITAREAAVFLLEILLLVAGGSEGKLVEIEAVLKEDAQSRATVWLNRLKHEGSVDSSCEIDARGLLLFIACFGIPSSFHNSDIIGLLQACDLKLISDSLRGSRVLLERITDVLAAMKTQKMFFLATEVASLFEIENKFSPLALLTCCLKDSEETYKKTTQQKKLPSLEIKAAAEKHVACMKDVAKFAAGHGWDLKEIGDSNLNNKIQKSEKEIADLAHKAKQEAAAAKRKLDELKSSLNPANLNPNPDQKRSKLAPNKPPLYLDGLPDPIQYTGGGLTSRPYDLPYLSTPPLTRSAFEGTRYPYSGGGDGGAPFGMRSLDGSSSAFDRIGGHLGRTLVGQSSIDRFPGLPHRSSGASHGSDLFGFADQVVDGSVSRRVDMTGLARPSPFSMSHHMY